MNLQRDSKIIIGELCASFERQLAAYRELRDIVRTNLSQLILSRGDAGVLAAGINKKVRLLDKINRERADMAGHIEFWQEYRKSVGNADLAAHRLNEILTETEGVIKEFLEEEEKLKLYVEKICKK